MNKFGEVEKLPLPPVLNTRTLEIKGTVSQNLLYTLKNTDFLYVLQNVTEMCGIFFKSCLLLEGNIFCQK